MSETNPKPLAFRYQFTAGAIAGISELIVMYPLDVVKTRMQLQISTPNSKIASEASSVIGSLSKIVKKEGASRLYKGISSPMLMEAPKRATKFACNDEFQKLFKSIYGTDSVNQKISILSGASAGIAESLVIVPFELVKIRLQDVRSSYNGPVDVVKDIVKKNGIKGLYSGIEATVWRNGVWNAGYFGIIYQVRSCLPISTTKTEKSINDLIAGFIGGTVGVLINTPFDVVKSRIQSTTANILIEDKSSGLKSFKYNWTLPSILTIYREEGVAALYKGFVPKILRLSTGGGLMLVVFTGVMDFFRELQH